MHNRKAKLAAERRPVTAALCVAVLVLVASCVSAPPPEEGMLSLPPGLTRPGWRTVAAGVEYASISPTRFVPRLHLLRADLEHSAVEVGLYPPQVHGAEPHEIAAPVDHRPGASTAALVSATPFRHRFSWRRGFRMDPVGLYKVGGKLYSQQEKQWGVLWQDYRGELHITDGLEQSERAYWAAGGFEPILIDGQNIGIHELRSARTAVGLGRDSRFLYIVVVEGHECARRGLTSRETAAVIAQLGAYHAMNFDGGNSAFLLLSGENGDLYYPYRGGRRSMACFFTVLSEISPQFSSSPGRSCDGGGRTPAYAAAGR